MFDVITIGSATLDIFVETNQANIVSVSSVSDKKEYMSYPYGSKLEVDNFIDSVGGGGLNTATNFANLGFKTSTILKIGEDIQGQTVIDTLVGSNIDTSNLIVSKNEKTGVSVILTSFQGDRTVLANRGANATISQEEVKFDEIKNSKWLYIAPLNGASTKILDEISEFAEKNNVNMAINVGSSSIKQGREYLDKILQTAEVVILNKEEAGMLTGISVQPDSKDKNFSDFKIHPDVVEMLKSLKSSNAKIVIITDGKNGVCAYDGKTFYKCCEFPAKVVSSLGAGDAFSSTFVGALIKTDWDIEQSLKYASVNAAAVVEKFGAQEGFLNFEQMGDKLLDHPEFLVQVC